MIKSGAVVINGQRGLFISEEDLGSAGDTFQFLIRITHKMLKEEYDWTDEEGTKRINNACMVMGLMKSSQPYNTAYDYVPRTHIKGEVIGVMDDNSRKV